MPILICPHCGVNNRTGSNFCNNCGTDLRDTDRGDTAPRDRQSTDIQPTKTDVETATPKLEERPADTKDTTSAKEASSTVPQGTEKVSTDTRPDTDESSSQSDVPSHATPAKSSEADQDSASEVPAHKLPARRDSGNEFAQGLGSGIPGLLEPQTIIGEPIEQIARPHAASQPVNDADLRRIRTLMNSEPNSEIEMGKVDNASPPSLHMPWIFALLALALALPIFLGFSGPTGAANELPGVATAFNTIDRFDKPIVLLLWEYDPATAGELDQVVEPVLRHLEDKGQQIVVASTMPTGPATARRMLRRVKNEQNRFGSRASIDLGYLPGGATILPLLGQDRAAVLPASNRANTALLSSELDLVLVVAAQAESVQQWLEQGQPLDQTTTIAVTSAAADPYLRPYLDSGQLSGLVSGFDGGISYQRIYNRSISASSTAASDTAASDTAIDAVPSVEQFRQQVYQNWGHFAILAIIVLGNFSMLSNRNNEKKQPESGTAGEGANV